jgi:alanyl-tRNA synthetase
MPETERLYYTNSYLTNINSPVLAISAGGLRVTLQQTNFYPTSGGQPHDLGTLDGIPVIDVIDDSPAIIHVLASPLTPTATHVTAEIDWTRRYHHMQQHTGQHLLSAVFEQLFAIPTLSFRMGDESSTIELGTKSLTAHQIHAVTLRATELARANPALRVTFEDAAHAQGLRKASERQGLLRIVEIPGIDRSACGGTHVASLAEVLPLQLREMEKVRGNIRIAFVCGNRALTRAQSDFQALSQIAATVAASLDSAEQQVRALKHSLTEAEKQKQHLENEAATRAGLELYTATAPGEDGIRRIFSEVPVLNESARTKARAFSTQPKSLILLHSSEDLLLACSPDSGFNAGALLKQSLSKYGARGGGSPTLAQGSLPDKAIIQDLISALSGRDRPPGLPADVHV